MSQTERVASAVKRMAEISQHIADELVKLSTLSRELAEMQRQLCDVVHPPPPCGPLYFEVVCDGFSAEDDSTDDRIFWVRANLPEQVEHALLGTGAVFREIELPESASIDFALPTQSLALYEAARKFLKD